MSKDVFDTQDISEFMQRMGMPQNPADRARYEKMDILTHDVFAKDERGKELLSLWRRSLEINPVARPGMDLLSIGIEQGKKDFIRNIILTIERAEK